MLSNLLLAAAFQVGPFYEQRPDGDYYALRPLVAREGAVTDVCWPVFTKHRDWWSFCLLVNEHDYADGYGEEYAGNYADDYSEEYSDETGEGYDGESDAAYAEGCDERYNEEYDRRTDEEDRRE